MIGATPTPEPAASGHSLNLFSSVQSFPLRRLARYPTVSQFLCRRELLRPRSDETSLLLWSSSPPTVTRRPHYRPHSPFSFRHQSDTTSTTYSRRLIRSLPRRHKSDTTSTTYIYIPSEAPPHLLASSVVVTPHSDTTFSLSASLAV